MVHGMWTMSVCVSGSGTWTMLYVQCAAQNRETALSTASLCHVLVHKCESITN